MRMQNWKPNETWKEWNDETRTPACSVSSVTFTVHIIDVDDKRLTVIDSKTSDMNFNKKYIYGWMADNE